jgi:hypothetical protein
VVVSTLAVGSDTASEASDALANESVAVVSMFERASESVPTLGEVEGFPHASNTIASQYAFRIEYSYTTNYHQGYKGNSANQ